MAVPVGCAFLLVFGGCLCILGHVGWGGVVVRVVLCVRCFGGHLMYLRFCVGGLGGCGGWWSVVSVLGWCCVLVMLCLSVVVVGVVVCVWVGLYLGVVAFRCGVCGCGSG